MVFLLFISNTFAQKVVRKTLQSTTKNIMATFPLVNSIQVIGDDNSNQIEVYAENEEDLSANFILKEVNNNILLQGFEQVNFEHQAELVDKQCTVQPLYNSYTIKIPQNRRLTLVCGQGNIDIQHLVGELEVQLDEGIIYLKEVHGAVKVQLHTGKITCVDLQDVYMDIQTRQGVVTNDFELNQNKKNTYKGVLGNALNKLEIKATFANIELHAVK